MNVHCVEMFARHVNMGVFVLETRENAYQCFTVLGMALQALFLLWQCHSVALKHYVPWHSAALHVLHCLHITLLLCQENSVDTKLQIMYQIFYVAV